MRNISRGIIPFNAVLLTLAMFLPTAAVASISYSFTNGTTPGEPGFANFDDPGFTKLLDNNTGSTNPSDTTWVGWQTNGADQITFDFGVSVTIFSVSLDFLRSTNPANIEVPTSVTIDGTDYPTADFVTDNTQGFVTYDGTFTGQTLVVTLNHPTSNWVFVNEAQFTEVPEPASLVLSVIGLASLLFSKKVFGRNSA